MENHPLQGRTSASTAILDPLLVIDSDASIAAPPVGSQFLSLSIPLEGPANQFSFEVNNDSTLASERLFRITPSPIALESMTSDPMVSFPCHLLELNPFERSG